ncbi:MAG: methyltransferase, partial [Proteobacteria bacterium]|nr:methyltransferase [Pseudomonadota bacterium]
MARQTTSSVLFLDALADELTGRWLVVGDDGTVAQALADRGAEVLSWNRYASGERPAAPMPPSGSFDRAVMALPRGRPAFAFALEMVASRLPLGAPVFVYGANDGGVKTAHKSMGPWFEDVEKLDARKHGRLLRGLRSAAEARGTVDAYAESVTLELPLGPASFTNLPGLFARGELDRGTALLLKALQSKGEKPVRRALDFASGMGVLGAGVKQRWPDAV